MNFKNILKATGLIVLSLVSIIVLYFGVEQVTDYLSDADYDGLAIISNASLAVIIYFFVRWFNRKINGLSPSDY